MKKILLVSVLIILSLKSFADGNQHEQIKKLLNRKIIFPENVIQEKVTVEIQFEIMDDGCLAVTGYKGDAAVVNYIASKVHEIKLKHDINGNNLFVYKFTFEKEK